MNLKSDYSLGWRDLQGKLQRDTRRKRFLRKLPLMVLYSGCALLVLLLLFHGRFPIQEEAAREKDTALEQGAKAAPSERFSREGLAGFLKGRGLAMGKGEGPFVLKGAGGEKFSVFSSLDPGLQGYVQGVLRRSRTRRAAAVVLNPADGRVLAMAGYGNEDPGYDMCTREVFPAASLFKIVSAAAAMETAGYTPDRTIYFEGGRHTLYKRQLRNRKTGYSRKTNLREAFGSSINCVFGKMGIYDLGREVISDYAERFLFNRPIPFDLPVERSTIRVPEDAFGIAEIASGFNRQTLISPLHAALLSAAAANNGMVMAPRLVERVVGQSGEVVYTGRPCLLTTPIGRGTAEGLRVLMQDTVSSGTCRKSFREFRRKRAFRGVKLGAKTGTINDSRDQFKYDWLTAYAIPEKGAGGICLAVLSVHGEKLGLRANELARQIIKYYLTS